LETVEQIKTRMKQSYKNKTGAEVGEDTDIGLRMDVFAAEILSLQANADWLKRQMFIQTATGENLDYHAQVRGVARKSGTPAQGGVGFSANTPAVTSINIPAGTLLSTADDVPKRYVTLAAGTIPAGNTDSGLVPVEAQFNGETGNVLSDKIVVMVQPPMGVATVTNPAALSGGTNDESDEALRQRLIDSYKSVENGANAVYYQNTACNVDGVYSAKVLSANRGPGTVDVFVAAKGAAVTTNQLAQVQEKIVEKREINVDIQAQAATPQLVNFWVEIKVKPGYYFSDVEQRCKEALSDYINSIGVGGNFAVSDAGNILYNIEGVSGYSLPLPSVDDIPIAPGSYAAVGTISISQLNS
jgi:uncharacterized phage protein gp47/JayE